MFVQGRGRRALCIALCAYSRRTGPADRRAPSAHRIVRRVAEMPQTNVDPETVKRKLRFDYLKMKNEPSQKTLDGFSSLLMHFHKPRLVIHDLIQEAANFMQRQFRLRWALIGLRGADGLYRYEVMSGLREEAWARQKKKVYAATDFTSTSDKYNYGEITKLTRVYLEEQNPLYKEDEQTVNRPALLRSRRESDETCLEADFVDTLILGGRDELLGWMDYSGTIIGTFPDPRTIRDIEVISAVIGAAIASQNRR